MKRLILIDTHAIIHRAYHALPPLTSPAGEPVGAVYGFTSILIRMLRDLKPDYIAAAFDMPGPTFRHLAYERYKATRPETPGDLASQFSKVQEVLGAFGIPIFQKEGYEADDILGTIAKKMDRKRGIGVVIVTGDADALQLVRKNVSVYAMKKGISDIVRYDEKAVFARYGFGPEQLVDFKALKGDPSDNIKGVKGIGEKTATALIRKFGTVERMYRALREETKEIPASLAGKLREGEKDAYLSRCLATIRSDVPISFDLKNAATKDILRQDAAHSLFQKLGFSSLLLRLEEKEGGATKKEAHASPSPIRGAASEISNPTSLALLTGDRIALFVFGNYLYAVCEKGPSVFRLRSAALKGKSARSFFEKRPWWAYDGKTVIHFLRRYGIECGDIRFDLMIAAYLTAQSSRDFSYRAIVRRELGRTDGGTDEGELAHFFDAAHVLEHKISQTGLTRVFEEIEMPVMRILAHLEERGLFIDTAVLSDLARAIDKEIKSLVREIYRCAGGTFNINSPSQLSRVLFENLAIKNHGLRKTEKGGVISTRESELQKLKGKHPIIENLLSYRELAKLKTTYVDVLPTLVDRKTGRIHTTLNQTIAATGRLSSSNPNLQNIPISSPLGREIRKAFIAPDGFLLAAFDYSQIELRVAAHIADDKKMIDAFRRGVDIHALTASEIYNVPLNQVTPELRRAAKTLNFGVLYGMGPRAFAQSTGMSIEESKKFIDEYFRDFAGIRRYIEETKAKVQERGYVETLFGRRRYIPEINSSNWQVKREAERMAVNAPVQGSAADLVKMAMIAVDQWIHKEKLQENVRMLLQVHDELLFEIKMNVIEKTVPKIKAFMEGVVTLKVPLVVDAKAGKNWGQMQPFEPQRQ